MSRKEFLNDKNNFPKEDLLFYFTKETEVIAGVGNAPAELRTKWFVSIPENFGLTSLGFDNHYEFLSYDTNFNVKLPEEFTKYDDDEDGKRVSFAQLSSWGKWLILAGNRNGLGAIDETDLVDLSAGPLLSKLKTEYADSVDLVSTIISDMFFKISSKEEISPAEATFFSKYSKYCTNKTLVSDLRIKITKQRGDSSIIQEEFKIEYFRFEDFKEEVTTRIQEYINGKLNDGEKHPFEETLDFADDLKKYYPQWEKHLARVGTVGTSGQGYNNGPGELGRLAKNFGPRFLEEEEKAKVLNRTGLLNKNKGYEGTRNLEIKKELIDSEIYSKPLEIDLLGPIQNFKYKSRESNEAVGFQIRHEEFDFYPYDYLETFYDPIREIGLFDFSTEQTRVGTDDVALGFYLKFIYSVETDLEDNNLDIRLGDPFEEEVEKCYQFLYRWVLVQYENIIRYRIVEKISENPHEQKTAKKLLEEAEKEVDSALEGLMAETEEEVTEEDINQRIEAYKQCALLLNMRDLKTDYANILKDRKNGTHAMHNHGLYNGRFYMVKDEIDALEVKNKLITPSGATIKPFFNITTDLLSALRPRLRLYKIYRDDSQEEGKIYSFEFPFPSHTDGKRASFLKTQDIDRGDGYGIKSFNFSFDGETPATSQKFIKADLTLFFQSFQDFAKERTAIGARSDGKDEKFRYVDLFVNTKHCPKDPDSISPLHYDPEFYRLRVDIGWEMRHDIPFRAMLKNRGIEFKDFERAINKMNKSFYLNLIDHEISIAENGTVTITANYMAFIEGLLGQRNALLSRDALELQNEAVRVFRNNEEKCKDRVSINELKSSINAIRIVSRDLTHQSIVEKLNKHNCLFYVHVESRDRKSFSRNKYFSKKPELIGADKIRGNAETDDKIKTETEEVEKYSHILEKYVRNPDPNNNERVGFFFMSDLVYFLLDSLYEDHKSERDEEIKIILSSFSLDLPFDEGSTDINIGEIPIEVEVFTKWYQEQIIDKDLEFISFLDFIKRFANYLITDIFSETCINEQQHKRLSFMSSPINSVKEEGRGAMDVVASEEKDYFDPILDINGPYKTGVLPIKTGVETGENIDPTSFVQYLLVYPHHRPHGHIGVGDPFKDSKRGVHHLYIGQDRGLVKNISFSKSDIQYIREARMMSQGQNSLLQLSSLYRCSIKMVGNTIFYPGMLLFLNPFGFGGIDFGMPYDKTTDIDKPNLSNIMGIGGYQKVITVSSTIDESGKFETTLDCIFEHTGETPDDEGNKSNKPALTKSNRGMGGETQRVPRICSFDDNKGGEAADAKDTCRSINDASKVLQNSLRNTNKSGKIDSKDIESLEKIK